MEQDKKLGSKNVKLLKSKKKLGWTGPKEIEELIYENALNSDYSVALNERFKGGRTCQILSRKRIYHL